MKTHVKKGDEVQIIAGKSKGKRGVVLSVNAKKQTVTVEGARILKKATKPSESDPDGGIKEIAHIAGIAKGLAAAVIHVLEFDIDGPNHISNVKKVS